MEEGNFILKNSEDEWPILGRIHRSYLPKFQSCEHLNVKTRIEEMEKMIEKLDQDEDRIIQELKKKLLDRSELHSLLKRLRDWDENFKKSIACKREDLHQLQVAQDNLCFMNKAYKMGTIFSGGELNTLSLHHKMLHKTKSIAEERQLLKETKDSQRGAIDPCLLIKNLKSQIVELESRMALERSSAGRKQLNREIGKLELERGNIISTANLRIWDSLDSKGAIESKIKDINIDLDETKKENLWVKDEIKRIRKEMRAVDKHVIPLQKKLVAVYRERGVRCKHLLELRKLQP